MRRKYMVRKTSYRWAVLGLASTGALVAVNSPARSSDLNLPGSVVETPGEFRTFVAGGAFWTGGDPVPYGTGFDNFSEIGFLGFGFGTIDPTVAPNVGWNAGAGFDYRFPASVWHINGQFRYGQAKGSGSGTPETFSGTGTDDNSHPTTESGSASTSASLTETHWLVDFGAGYDISFRHNPLQVNFGIRVANLTSEMTSPETFGLLYSDPMATPPDPTSGTENISSTTTRKSSFLGAGPRVGVEGAVPFGKFSFDYAANAAWLIGNARIHSDTIESFSVVSMPAGSGTNLNYSGVTNGSSYSRTINVFNGDFLVGVSYWLTPAMKISVNYRLDAYLNALKTYDINGNLISLDRYFQGPELALAAKF